MAHDYALGVDVGATKLLGGVVDCRTGVVLNSVKIPSPLGGADALVEAIEEVVARTLAEAPKGTARHVQRIGLGVAGQVDRRRGVLLSAPNLGGGVKGVALAEPLEGRFDRRVLVGNDVETAALGESRFGAGRGVKLFACVFVGTGIGGALVQDGVHYRGAADSAGEIGHVMLQAGGRLCGCGQRGHLEAYASRTAIVETLRERVKDGAECSIKDLLMDRSQRVRSKPLSQAVEENDPLVVSVIAQAATYLGMGLASLINLWSPARVVLGGGVIDRIDLLFSVAAQQAKSAALQVAAQAVTIVRSELGDASGMIGAALLTPDAGRAKPG